MSWDSSEIRFHLRSGGERQTVVTDDEVETRINRNGKQCLGGDKVEFLY